MLEALIGVLGVAVMGILGWAFTISNRVAVLEADRGSLKELIELRLVDITRRLDRIEKKLDHDTYEE